MFYHRLAEFIFLSFPIQQKLHKLVEIVCLKGNIIITLKGADAFNLSVNRNYDFLSLPVLIKYFFAQLRLVEIV
jgi:hypothetical protein